MVKLSKDLSLKRLFLIGVLFKYNLKLVLSCLIKCEICVVLFLMYCVLLRIIFLKYSGE